MIIIHKHSQARTLRPSNTDLDGTSKSIDLNCFRFLLSDDSFSCCMPRLRRSADAFSSASRELLASFFLMSPRLRSLRAKLTASVLEGPSKFAILLALDFLENTTALFDEVDGPAESSRLQPSYFSSEVTSVFKVCIVLEILALTHGSLSLARIKGGVFWEDLVSLDRSKWSFLLLELMMSSVAGLFLLLKNAVRVV